MTTIASALLCDYPPPQIRAQIFAGGVFASVLYMKTFLFSLRAHAEVPLNSRFWQRQCNL